MIDLKEYPATVLSAGHKEWFFLGPVTVEFQLFSSMEDDRCFLTAVHWRKAHPAYEYVHVREVPTGTRTLGNAVVTRKELMMMLAEDNYVLD